MQKCLTELTNFQKAGYIESADWEQSIVILLHILHMHNKARFYIILKAIS